MTRTARDTIKTHMALDSSAVCKTPRSWFTELRLTQVKRNVTCKRCLGLMGVKKETNRKGRRK